MVTWRPECDKEPSTRLKKRSPKPHNKKNLKYSLGVTFLPLLLFFFACAAGTVKQPPLRGDRAQVSVYLQPVPPEVRRIAWILGDLSVIKPDGTRISLRLNADHYTGSDLEGRQTLLASGFVPPGPYSGVSLTFRGASLKGEEEDAALLVPEEPLFIKAPFKVSPSEVLPLFLSLDSAGLVNGGFAFSPDFSLALPGRELSSLTGFLTIPEGDRITVFNRKTLRVVGAIATGRNPSAMAVDPTRGRAYVAVAGDNAIEVIDVLGGSVRERITLRSGDEPVDLALSGDGQTLLSANYASDTVSIIDPIQAVETDRIEVSHGPTSVTITGNGNRAYVTCSLSGNLSVIDLFARNVSAVITMEETAPLKAALDGEEDRLFIVGENSPDLAVVDTKALTVTDRVYVGTGSVSIVVDELSGLTYVGRRSGSEIAIIDPSVLLPVDYIELKGAPGNMALDPQEKVLLVLIPGKRTLQKIDLVSRRGLAEMELDGTPGKVTVLE